MLLWALVLCSGVVVARSAGCLLGRGGNGGCQHDVRRIPNAGPMVLGITAFSESKLVTARRKDIEQKIETHREKQKAQ